MKRWLATMAMVGAWAGFGIPTASAQIGGYTPPQTNPNPTYSPYLNLIPNNPFIQYFGLGQTQMNNARALQNLQNQVNYQQMGGNQFGMGGMNNMGGQQMGLMSGHPVMFMYTGQYYPRPGMPYAGMGMSVGGMAGMGGMGMGGMGMGGYGMGGYGMGGYGGMGMGGGGQTIYSPLPQGYSAPMQR